MAVLRFVFLLLLICFSFRLSAQHEPHQMPPKPVPVVKPEIKPQQKKLAPSVKKPATTVKKAPVTPRKPIQKTNPTNKPVQESPMQPAPDSAAENHSGHLQNAGETEHSTHQMPMPDSAMHQNHAEMDHSAHMKMPGMEMTHAFSRNLPMTRNGSGTSWNPDATPMYAYMFGKGNWNFMAHGAVFLRYTNHDLFEAGKRGDSKVDAPNWFMLMAQRKIGKRGLFNTNLMMSLDPVTEENGYPLLFQSGETYQGKPLVDRQHPHDLISELSVAYTQAFSEDIDLTAYLGYPGEPALGPTAFMHRVSSMNNPDAPLGHHWQDASHIQFGVATLGLRYKQLKLEGSNFTGREPDENRYNFDKPRFDSYSYRLQFAPSANYIFQFSQGFLNSPEVSHPGEDVTRTTASILYSSMLNSTEMAEEQHFTSALVWGYNKSEGTGEHAVLLEGNYQRHKLAYYGRYEFIQKDAEELQILEDTGFNDHDHPVIYNVHALTLGSNYRMAQFWKLNLALGVQATIYRPDERLQNMYGKTPVSGEIYLRLVPGFMQMHH